MCEQQTLSPDFNLRAPRGLMTPHKFITTVLESMGHDSKLADTFGVSDWAPGYAEPGYTQPEDGKCVLFGNWNDKQTRAKEPPYTVLTTDDRPKRFSAIAEAAGYTCEWSDEWSTCSGCQKAVRTSPDSYSWSPAYAWTENELLCRECVVDNPEEYLAELSGDATRCLSMALNRSIDLTKHGYTKFNAEPYEAGFHPGQTDKPETIAEEVRKAGYTDFIFVQEEQGQFDTRFSVWVKAEEEDTDNDE